jgi:long-chain alkane monooxygenase
MVPAARNLGLEHQVPHDERYEVAEEFMEVVYKLWEGSWEDDAVRLDKVEGVYADPEKVHPIGHNGRYFDVPGIGLTEPSPQRTPVIFQAGASPRGRDTLRSGARPARVALRCATTRYPLSSTACHRW